MTPKWAKSPIARVILVHSQTTVYVWHVPKWSSRNILRCISSHVRHKVYFTRILNAAWFVSCFKDTAVNCWPPCFRRPNWKQPFEWNPDPCRFHWITIVSHLHPCPWPGVCGKPLSCCGPCCPRVCFRDCRTSGAFCREEWHPRSPASSRAGGPLLGGSWMSIWESADNKATNQTSNCSKVFTVACVRRVVVVVVVLDHKGPSNQLRPYL